MGINHIMKAIERNGRSTTIDEYGDRVVVSKEQTVVIGLKTGTFESGKIETNEANGEYLVIKTPNRTRYIPYDSISDIEVVSQK